MRLTPETPEIAKPTWSRYGYGEKVQKRTGSHWHGYVVGYYSTALNPCGICVESAFEVGAVQIYPQTALERWYPPT